MPSKAQKQHNTDQYASLTSLFPFDAWYLVLKSKGMRTVHTSNLSK